MEADIWNTKFERFLRLFAESQFQSGTCALSSALQSIKSDRAAKSSVGKQKKHHGQIRNICSFVIVTFTPCSRLSFNQEMKLSHKTFHFENISSSSQQHMKGSKYIKTFNVHESVHRNNTLIHIQQDAKLHSLFYLETSLHVSGGTTTHHQ
jgi:hypothetical protein